MRAALDRLYLAMGWMSAACFVIIAMMVGVQLIGRIVDLLMRAAGFKPYGFIVQGLAEIAGYLLATASLLALALALKSGSHIRITMLLSALPQQVRYWAEILSLAVGAVFAAYITARLGLMAIDSLRFHEVSHGLVPVPLAWPQAAMALGLLVFTIALVDELVVTITRGRPSFVAAEDAIQLGKES